MNRLATKTFCGSAAAALLACGQAIAMEPGNFGQTLTGTLIGAPIAAPAPPGVYSSNDFYWAPAGTGTGQNLGTTVAVPLWVTSLLWSTGYHILGANLSLAISQPFYWTAAWPTNGATLGGNGSGFPQGATIWWETTANTRITPFLLQWQLGGGFFASAGLTLIPPDGSTYNGTLNPDYFTWEPSASVAYLTPDWHVTANFRYDINSASKGHTGTYQIVANAAPVVFNPALAATVASIGNGYTSGNELFLDVAALREIGKFELGPVANFKWQTTADTPGGGFSCAQVAASLGPTLGCGRATNASVGALVGYNFGLVDLQAWATDSVYNKDDFGGWAIFSRLTFRLWGPEATGAPLVTKAH